MGKLRQSKAGSRQYKRTNPFCRDKLFTSNSRIEIMKNVEHRQASDKTISNFISTKCDHVIAALDILKFMLEINSRHSNMSTKLFKNSA